MCEQISIDIRTVVNNIGFVSSFEGKNKRRENNVLFCPTWFRDCHQHWLWSWIIKFLATEYKEGGGVSDLNSFQTRINLFFSTSWHIGKSFLWALMWFIEPFGEGQRARVPFTRAGLSWGRRGQRGRETLIILGGFRGPALSLPNRVRLTLGVC